MEEKTGCGGLIWIRTVLLANTQKTNGTIRVIALITDILGQNRNRIVGDTRNGKKRPKRTIKRRNDLSIA